MPKTAQDPTHFKDMAVICLGLVSPTQYDSKGPNIDSDVVVTNNRKDQVCTEVSYILNRKH